MSKIAFVLGNGRSRSGVDLAFLKQFGKIYGCNALYREFAPDVLVATDPGISQEIQSSGYSKCQIFYTRKPLEGTGAKMIELYPGFSSGPIALAYACHEGAEKIYLLGFDLSGTNGKFNNIYADTAHYRKSSDTPTFYGNWVSQIKTVVETYDDRKFARVIVAGNAIPEQWNNLKNLCHITQEEFFSAINNQ